MTARQGGRSSPARAVRLLRAWAVPLSAVLHGAVLLAVLLPWRSPRPPGDAEPPRLQVELVDQQAMQLGEAQPGPAAPEAPETDAARPTPPGSTAPPTTASSEPPPTPPPPPALPRGAGDVPMPTLPQQRQAAAPAAPAPPPSPPPPARAAQQARADAPPAPRVNLGSDEEQEALQVRGDDLVPPQPDALRRNLPPRYPADSARRGAQGTVELRVRVTEAGQAGQVEVSRSSGDASLDRSAAEAVRRWHFTPARRSGIAVPFDFLISVRFVIGNG